ADIADRLLDGERFPVASGSLRTVSGGVGEVAEVVEGDRLSSPITHVPPLPANPSGPPTGPGWPRAIPWRAHTRPGTPPPGRVPSGRSRRRRDARSRGSARVSLRSARPPALKRRRPGPVCQSPGLPWRWQATPPPRPPRVPAPARFAL